MQTAAATERPWDPETDNPSDIVWRQAMTLWQNQGEDRRQFANDCLCLYYGNDANGIEGHRAGLSYISPTLGDEPPGYNVIQSCVDTKTAHIVRNKVRPYFLTEKGDSELREKAQGMQRAVEAIFHAEGMYGELQVDTCFDGNLFEAGNVKVIPDYANMRVRIERVFPWEVLVSERESKKRKPRQMWHPQVIDRAVLLDAFKDESEEVLRAIRDAKPAPPDMSDHEFAEEGEVADQVVVVEYWHLPSGRVDLSDPKTFGLNSEGKLDNRINPGHDGIRIICLEEMELLREPWPYDSFPIKSFRPMPKRIGYWSMPIPEMLAGGQLALNRMNARVDAIMHLHARPLLYLWRQAKVNAGKISNDVASILEGNAPAQQAMQYITPQSVPAEYINRIREIISWCEKQAGLSEMSIAATKPAGVDHAPGMQHLADTESVRHTPAFRAWEQFHIEVAEAVVEACRLLHEYAKRTGKKFEIIWGDSKDLKRIDWGDVDLKRDQYHLKVFPTNLLPTTPGAKISRVIELVREQLLSREEARTILIGDYPDIEGVAADATAQMENIERHLDALLRGEAYADHMPQPYLNLELAKSMSANRINRLEADGEPDEKIDTIRQFNEDAIELARIMTANDAAAAQGIAPPAPAGPPGPPGVPMAPPGGAPPGPPMPMGVAA